MTSPDAAQPSAPVRRCQWCDSLIPNEDAERCPHCGATLMREGAEAEVPGLTSLPVDAQAMLEGEEAVSGDRESAGEAASDGPAEGAR